MQDEVYSVKTLIVNNGKNISGLLILSSDKYKFNDSVWPINWERANCTVGTTTVKSLFLKSGKPCVSIKEGGDSSPAFLMEQDQIKQLINVILELREQAKQTRIAAEERRRVEEEERKRQEEERRRKAQEARRLKEQEERKRRIAIARRLERRKQRITEEVEIARSSVVKIDLTGGDNLVFRKAWSCVADNPYRILGVSVSARRGD